MEDTVAAVIATYRPSSSLTDLAVSTRDMVNRLAIVDDASPCTFDGTFRDLSSTDQVDVVRFHNNQGIARSLNTGLSLAKEYHASWLLTLDQDTRLPPTYVQSLLDDAQRAIDAGIPVGVIGPRVIHDRDDTITYPETWTNGWLSTAEILQSGAMWHIGALDSIGGFDESFKMDAVDAAACLTLREHGYSVLLSSSAALQHEWGQSRRIRFAGRTVAISEHSPDRRETIVRNRLRLTPREFRQSPIQGVRALRRVVVGSTLALVAERDRWPKARAVVRGVLKHPKTGSGQ